MIVQHVDVQKLQHGVQIFTDKTHKDGTNGQLLRANAHGNVFLKIDSVGPLSHVRIRNVGRRYGRMGGRSPAFAGQSVVRLLVVLVGTDHFFRPFNVSFEFDNRPTIVRTPQGHDDDPRHSQGNAQLTGGPWQGQNATTNVSLDQMNQRLRVCGLMSFVKTVVFLVIIQAVVVVIVDSVGGVGTLRLFPRRCSFASRSIGRMTTNQADNVLVIVGIGIVVVVSIGSCRRSRLISIRRAGPHQGGRFRRCRRGGGLHHFRD
mmetsp:Transcript_22577/g.39633  ORF Transcript_22577/g.39633 Transcript_22577/m.39633 type:complete len:260 (+) Transcript_22577:1368-2147(+)